MAPVDRKKYAADVLEHVLGGVHATADDAVQPLLPHEVVTLGDRSWLGLGTARDPRHHDSPALPESGGRRRPDAYESDRRGEHQYERDVDSPSHRTRQALKKRLERKR